MIVHFDTLRYANVLEQAGIDRGHAEAIAKMQVEVLTDVVDKELVTKGDLTVELAKLEARLGARIDGLEAKLGARGDALEAKLRAQIDGVEAKLGARSDTFEARLGAQFSDLEAKLASRSDTFEAKLGAQFSDLEARLGAQFSAQEAKLGAQIVQARLDIETIVRRDIDALRLQLRSLQFGGAIAAFALSLVVMLSRLIK